MSIIPTGLGSLIRFLLGILLLQIVTVLVVYTALHTDWMQTWWLFAALSGAISLIVAFWFNTIVYADRHRTVSRVNERFSKERDKIRVKAAKEQVKETRSRVRERTSVGWSLKTGLMLGGAVGVGVALMLAQVMTLGLATLTLAGGTALGYTARVRQERLTQAKRLATEEQGLRIIPSDSDQLKLPRRLLKS